MRKKWNALLVLLLVMVLPAIVFGAGQVKRYTFNISIGAWNILPDVQVKSLMINNQIPDPAIEVTEGDTVEVIVVNNSALLDSLKHRTIASTTKMRCHIGR